MEGVWQVAELFERFYFLPLAKEFPSSYPCDGTLHLMAQVHFTTWLQGLVPDGSLRVSGATVGDALAGAFEAAPQLRSYVLDERGTLRKHVCIFADGKRLASGVALGHPIGPNSKLYVMQALSGG